jgi:polygalacturonase
MNSIWIRRFFLNLIVFGIVPLVVWMWIVPDAVRADEIVDVTSMGVPSDGRNDAAVALQRVIDAADGRTLFFPNGEYRLDQQVAVRSGTHLKFAPGATVIRGWNGGTSWRGALFGNADFNVKTSDVTIEGGRFIGNGLGGRVINWIGDRWTIKDIHIESWGRSGTASKAICWIGDDTQILNNVIEGSPADIGQGGVVMHGGRGAVIRGNDITAGDDAIAAFPIAPLWKGHRNRFPDTDISDVLVEGNKVRSLAARAIAVGLHTPEMRATVRNITFRDITGASSGQPMLALIFNGSHSGGIVDDVTLENVSIISVGENPRLKHGLKIHGASPRGIVSNVSVAASNFSKVPDSPLMVLGNVSNLMISDASFDGSGSNRAAIFNGTLSAISIQRTTFVGGDSPVIVVGGGTSNQIDGFVFADNEILGIAKNGIGLDLRGVSRARITGNRVSGPAPDHFRGIVERKNSFGNVIERNSKSTQ